MILRSFLDFPFMNTYTLQISNVDVQRRFTRMKCYKPNVTIVEHLWIEFLSLYSSPAMTGRKILLSLHIFLIPPDFQLTKQFFQQRGVYNTYIVPDFTISVYSSSCKSHFFILFSLLFLFSIYWPPQGKDGMPRHRQRKKRLATKPTMQKNT